jgi:hypothetical protein
VLRRNNVKHLFKAIVLTVAGASAGAKVASKERCRGVAGHMAGHGALGTAGGCAVGHHMANRTKRTNNEGQLPRPSSSECNQNRP